MVQFGKYFTAQQGDLNPAWAKCYLQYESLKVLLDGIIARRPGASTAFLSLLDLSWAKQAAFYKQLQQELDGLNVARSFAIDKILNIHKFGWLNCEACRKIVKKHDKHSALKLAPSWQLKYKFAISDNVLCKLKEVSDAWHRASSASLAQASNSLQPPQPQASNSLQPPQPQASNSLQPPQPQDHGNGIATKTAVGHAAQEDGVDFPTLACSDVDFPTQACSDLFCGIETTRVQPNRLAGMKHGDHEMVELAVRPVDAHNAQILGNATPVQSSTPVNDKKGAGGKGIDNSNFVRAVTKWWVKTEDIPALIAEMARHLPIYVFGQSDAQKNPAQSVDSVCFDNLRTRQSYRSRINKEEGARMLRIRWYNDDMSNCFIERKVHHVAWVAEDSSKNRFKLPLRDVMPFVRGQLKMPAHIHKRGDCGALYNEIQNMISDGELVPVARTSYRRISFQQDDCNDVRVSLDLNLTLIREKTGHLEWFTPEDKILEEDRYNTSFGVIEIKLKGDHVASPPLWLQNLMQNGSLMPCPKFSKFCTATYLTGDRSKLTLPHWIHNHPECFHTSARSESEAKNLQMYATNDPETQNCFTKGPFARKVDPETDMSNETVSRIKNKYVEPKTIFANERTFIRWLNTGLLISLFGISYLDSKEGFAVPCCLVGLCVMISAMSQFYCRLSLLLVGSVDGYAEIYRPLLISGSIVVCVAVSLVIGRPIQPVYLIDGSSASPES